MNLLQFKTNKGNVSSKFGGGDDGEGSNSNTVTAPTGYVLGGMRVRAAKERGISQIQFLWVPNPSSNDRCVPFEVPYTPMCGSDGVEINYLVEPP